LAGLIVWIAYLALDDDALAWVAFVLLIPVALLGFAMLLRWLPVYRARADVEAPEPAERHFPIAVVGGHGVFAVATVVLVLLTALGVGGS
jgi:manganese efflux pump family protein